MVIHWHSYSSLAVIKFVLILALKKKKTQVYLTGNSYFLSKPQRQRQWKMVLIFWQCSQRSFVTFSRCSQNQFWLRFLVEVFVDRFLWLYSQNWSHGQFTCKTQNCCVPACQRISAISIKFSGWTKNVFARKNSKPPTNQPNPRRTSYRDWSQ